jgi:Domain of unknown function (DUF4111)
VTGHFRTLEELSNSTRTVVRELCSGLAEIFGDDLAAIWLYGGSLFAPHAVDIDLHVLLRRMPDQSESERLRKLHARISNNVPWVDELDAWYIRLGDAGSPDEPFSVGPWQPGLKDGHWSLHRAHWLAGACIVVQGLEPSDVVPPPRWDELEATLRAEFEAEQNVASAYWTLQLCRVLASLETRDVVRSKLDSGAWALKRLPTRAHVAINAAMRYYSGRSREGDDALIKRSYPTFRRMIRGAFAKTAA